jgi:hypothetical protein
MRMSGIKISILILLIAAFISGCTLVMGIIALTSDDPISLVVTVESNPSGADVYLNEKKLGTTPLEITIEGLSKEHKIVFVKSGYQTKIERVSISADRQLDEKYLSVTKPDGTSVQIEDSTLNVVLKKEVIAP